MSQNVNDNENLNDPNDQNPLEIEGTAADLPPVRSCRARSTTRMALTKRRFTSR
jgi:hypothetical protein